LLSRHAFFQSCRSERVERAEAARGQLFVSPACEPAAGLFLPESLRFYNTPDPPRGHILAKRLRPPEEPWLVAAIRSRTRWCTRHRRSVGVGGGEHPPDSTTRSRRWSREYPL